MGAALIAAAGGVLVGAAVWSLLQRSLGRQWEDALSQLRRIGMPQDAAVAQLPRRPARYSSLPFLHRTISRISPTAALALFLEQAGARMTVSVFLLLTGVAGLAAYVLLGWLPVGAGMRPVLAAAAATVPFGLLSARRRERFQKLNEQLPDAVRMIASALRAGLGLDGGLAIVVNELPDPIQSELRKLLNETQLYGNAREALAGLAGRVPLPGFQLFAASASLHRDIGGNFAILLDRLERSVRDRLQLNRELQTLTAESRMSGWVVGLLPLLVGLVIYVMNPSYFQILLTHPSGRVLFGAGIGLELLGFVMIRWMTTPKVS